MKMFERKERERHSDPDSDLDLHRAAGRGSEEAMAALYRRHGALIYRFSLRLIQDPSIAEEVTQDVFLALLRQSDRFDPSRAALPTWLCGIARRLIWKHLERRERHSPIVPSDNESEAESPDDNPGVALSRKETVEAVQRGIDGLPLQWKEVIVLCEFEEMTYEDAALVLGVPVGTVRSRLHRAKARLALLLRGAGVSVSVENKP
jgi:RNA polymerase sigma-70 factor (ECF subfamily)